MEASRPEEGREDKPRVRASARIALGAALLSLALSTFASVALYTDLDMNSKEVPGPHPVLGWLGGAALEVELFVFVPCLGLAALALLLALCRPPRARKGAMALAALLLCLAAFGIRSATIDRARGNAETLASYARNKRAVVVVFRDLRVELLRPEDFEHLRWVPSP